MLTPMLDCKVTVWGFVLLIVYNLVNSTGVNTMDKKEKLAKKADIAKKLDISHTRLKDEEVNTLADYLKRGKDYIGKSVTWRESGKGFDHDDTYRYETTYTRKINDDLSVTYTSRTEYDDGQVNETSTTSNKGRDILKALKFLKK